MCHIVSVIFMLRVIRIQTMLLLADLGTQVAPHLIGLAKVQLCWVCSLERSHLDAHKQTMGVGHSLKFIDSKFLNQGGWEATFSSLTTMLNKILVSTKYLSQNVSELHLPIPILCIPIEWLEVNQPSHRLIFVDLAEMIW